MLIKYKMVIIKFNPDDILKEKALDVMTVFKSEITSLVTEAFFSNPEYRFNFYKTLVKLFDYFKKKIFKKNTRLSKYYNEIYFVFKGGNVIKAVIDLSEENMKKKIISKKGKENIKKLKTTNNKLFMRFDKDE